MLQLPYQKPRRQGPDFKRMGQQFRDAAEPFTTGAKRGAATGMAHMAGKVGGGISVGTALVGPLVSLPVGIIERAKAKASLTLPANSHITDLSGGAYWLRRNRQTGKAEVGSWTAARRVATIPTVVTSALTVGAAAAGLRGLTKLTKAGRVLPAAAATRRMHYEGMMGMGALFGGISGVSELAGTLLQPHAREVKPGSYVVYPGFGKPTRIDRSKRISEGMKKSTKFKAAVGRR